MQATSRAAQGWVAPSQQESMQTNASRTMENGN